MSVPVIQSYIYTHDQKWLVSTIERDSSAVYYPGRYFETCVWLMDGNERGEMRGTFGSDRRNISVHFRVCEHIFNHGAEPSE